MYIYTSLQKSSKELPGGDIVDQINRAPISESVDNLCHLFQKQINNVHWLFLDNWESADNTDNGKIVNVLFQHTNQKLTIVITSRVKPSFNTSRLYEKGIAQVFDQSDLQFSFAEFMESLSKRKLHFEREEIEQLWNLSRGWCVNTAFINETAVQNKKAIAASHGLLLNFSVSREYISEEFLNNLNSTFLDDLIKSSCVNTVSLETMSILLDSEIRAKNFLMRLRQAALPLYEDSSNEITYHPTFKDALSKQAQATLTNAQICDLHHRLIDYYVSKHLFIDALQKATISENSAFLLEFIDKYWLQIIEQGGLRDTNALLSKLTGDFKSHPLYIKLYSNVLSQVGDNSSLIRFLSNRIDPSAYPKHDTLLSTLWVKYFWAILHSTNRPTYKEVVNSWNDIENSKGPYQEKDKIGVEVTLSCAAYMELNFDKAKYHILKSLEYIGDSSFVYRAGQLDNLAIFEFYTDNVEEALRIYYNNQEECSHRDIHHGMSIRLLQIAWILISTGHIQEGLETLQEAERTIIRYEPLDTQAKMYLNRYYGVGYYYLGYHNLAIEQLRASLKYANNYNDEEIIYTKIYIDYFELLEGNADRITSQQEIDLLDKRSQSYLLNLVYESFKGYTDGDKKMCRESAVRLLDICTNVGLHSWQALSNFLLSLCAEISEDVKAATNHAANGLSILLKRERFSFPMYNETIIQRIIVHAVRQGHDAIADNLMGSDYVLQFSHDSKDLLELLEYDTKHYKRLLELATGHSIRGLELLAGNLTNSESRELANAARLYLSRISSIPLSPIRIHLFGNFCVLANNRQVAFKRNKSKQLLQILSLKYPDPVHEETLIEFLWPNAELSKGKSSLRTAVKDLRQDLDPYHKNRSDSYLLHSQSQYILKLPEQSFIDLDEFRQLSKEIFNSSNSVSSKEYIDRCYACVHLYSDVLLADDLNSAFSIEEREYYHSRYKKLILRLSESLLDENRTEEAREHLIRALEYDPLWREGVEQLIRLFVRIGKTVNAYETYNNYRLLLEKELGLKPDNELSEMVNRIM